LFGIVFSFHLESPVLFCQKIPLRVGIILGDGYRAAGALPDHLNEKRVSVQN